jgi:hypothetical protein
MPNSGRKVGLGPAKLKREKVFRMADSDDKLPLRTPAPGFYSTLCQSATKFPEAIEIDTDDDDFGFPSVAQEEDLEDEEKVCIGSQ